jgi:GNAT superfamily N-acetyltransferase
MCAALNCPAWRLQNSLVAPTSLGDDEYTAMVRGLVHLAGCFHPETNEYIGAPHPKMVDRHIRTWMESKELYPDEEEKALSCMVAFVNRFDGSLVHRFVPMVPEERRLALAPPRRRRGIGAWSFEEVSAEIGRLGMTDAIRSQADASMARSDAREFLEKKGKQKEKSGFEGRRDGSSGKENWENPGNSWGNLEGYSAENLERVEKGGRKGDRFPS